MGPDFSFFRKITSEVGVHPASIGARFFAPQLSRELTFALASIEDVSRDRAALGSAPVLSASASGQLDVGDASFSRLFAGMSREERRLILTRIGTETLQEIFSLSTESSPELFWEGVFHLAGRLERGGREPLAAVVYEWMLQRNESFPEAGLTDRVRKRRDALGGQGSFGARFEFSARRFVREVSSPGALLGMGIASTVFSTCRLGILSRLWASTGPSWITRGFGSRALASTAALIPESGAFWLVSKGFEEGLHPGAQDWSLRQNLSELRNLSLGLGMMRLSGFAFRRAYQGFRGPNAAVGGLELSVLHQTAMFVGILGSNVVETRLGWRRPRSLTDSALESLATLLHFNVAGRISTTAFPSLYGMQRGAEARLVLQENAQVRSLDMRGLGGEGGGRGDSLLAYSGFAGKQRSSPGVFPLLEGNISMMSADAPSERPKSISAWSWGSVAPPAFPSNGAAEALEGQGEAVEWLGKAVRGETDLSPLNHTLRWFYFSERHLMMRETLQHYSFEQLLSALTRRVSPSFERPERMAALSLINMLALECPSKLDEVHGALLEAAGRFPSDTTAIDAWETAKSELRDRLEAGGDNSVDSAGFLDGIQRTKEIFERVGFPHRLANELFEVLPNLPGAPRNYRKYFLLGANSLSKNVLPPGDAVDHYLRALFLSDRALESEEWVAARTILSQGQAQLRRGEFRGAGSATAEYLATDLAERERGVVDSISDLVALENTPENPFLQYDHRIRVSSVALVRLLNLRSREYRTEGRSVRADFHSRYAAELFDRNILPSWRDEISEPEIRGSLQPHFQTLSEILGHRFAEGAPHWPSLLGQVSENILRSSHPEHVFRVLRDIHRIRLAPEEAFQDTLISLVTGLEIELRQAKDPRRIQALQRTKGLLSGWFDSL